MPGCLGGLPEQSTELRPAVGTGGETAQAEQPEVRVGGLGEPVEQERHQLVHEAGGPGEPLCQFENCGARARGIREAECCQAIADEPVSPEPFLGRLCAENLQQGPEKEPLVDRPGGRLVAGQVGFEQGEGPGARPVAVTEHTCQVGSRRRAGGQCMHLAVFYELEPVFGGPQEPVGVRKAICVRSGDIPACSQSLERSQRGRCPQRRVVATVHEL